MLSIIDEAGTPPAQQAPSGPQTIDVLNERVGPLGRVLERLAHAAAAFTPAR